MRKSKRSIVRELDRPRNAQQMILRFADGRLVDAHNRPVTLHNPKDASKWSNWPIYSTLPDGTMWFHRLLPLRWILSSRGPLF